MLCRLRLSQLLLWAWGTGERDGVLPDLALGTLSWPAETATRGPARPMCVGDSGHGRVKSACRRRGTLAVGTGAVTVSGSLS
jgi:hypothetical protein